MERVRTLKEAIKFFREQDPETAISEHALRRAINTGEIPHARSGNRFLVSLDVIERYFSGQLLEDKPAPAEEKKPRVAYVRRYV